MPGIVDLVMDVGLLEIAPEGLRREGLHPRDWWLDDEIMTNTFGVRAVTPN